MLLLFYCYEIVRKTKQILTCNFFFRCSLERIDIFFEKVIFEKILYLCAGGLVWITSIKHFLCLFFCVTTYKSLVYQGYFYPTYFSISFLISGPKLWLAHFYFQSHLFILLKNIIFFWLFLGNKYILYLKNCVRAENESLFFCRWLVNLTCYVFLLVFFFVWHEVKKDLGRHWLYYLCFYLLYTT